MWNGNNWNHTETLILIQYLWTHKVGPNFYPTTDHYIFFPLTSVGLIGWGKENETPVFLILSETFYMDPTSAAEAIFKSNWNHFEIKLEIDFRYVRVFL